MLPGVLDPPGISHQPRHGLWARRVSSTRRSLITMIDARGGRSAELPDRAVLRAARGKRRRPQACHSVGSTRPPGRSWHLTVEKVIGVVPAAFPAGDGFEPVAADQLRAAGQLQPEAFGASDRVALHHVADAVIEAVAT